MLFKMWKLNDKLICCLKQVEEITQEKDEEEELGDILGDTETSDDTKDLIDDDDGMD